MTHTTDAVPDRDLAVARREPAVAFDATAVRAWSAATSDQHPDLTNAEALGVDDTFGRGQHGFLSTVAGILYAWPPGLIRRSDVRDVSMWLVPDGDILERGALITVDLVNGVRLASPHQDIKDFADRADRGIAPVLSALSHLAAQACLLVDTYYQVRSPSGGSAGPTNRRWP